MARTPPHVDCPDCRSTGFINRQFACRAVALVAVVLGPPTVTAAQTAGSSSRPAGGPPRVIRVAIDEECAPFEFVNAHGRVDGFTPNLLREIGKAAGVTFEFVPMHGPEIRTRLEGGSIDLINIVCTPQRVHQYDMSTPHSQMVQAIFRRRGDREIVSLAALTGHTVGLQARSIAMERLADRTDFERRIVHSRLDGLLLLNLGEIDAFVCGQQAGVRLVSEYGLSNVELAEGDHFTQDFCFAVRKGDRRLMSTLERHLAALRESGRHRELVDTWLTGGQMLPGWLTRHRRILTVGGLVAASVLVLFLLWNLTLRRMVRLRTTALQKSQRRFQVLAHIAPVGVFQTDAAGGCLYVNPGWCEIAGLTSDQARGRGWARGLHPADRDRVSREWDEAAAAGRIFQSEYRFQNRKHGTIWVFGQAVAERDADGEIVGYVGTVTNITERKRAERGLEELVAGTASVTGGDFFPAVVRHLAAALGVRYAFVTELIGDRRSRVRSLAFWSGNRWTNDVEYHLVKTPCEHVIRDGIYCCPQRVQERFPEDGDLKVLGAESYLGVALKDTSGSTIGHLCVLHDRPLSRSARAESIMNVFAARAAAELERTRVEQALRASEARLARAQRVARMGSWDWDVTADELHWSDETFRVLGLDERRAKASYDTFLRLVHPEDEVRVRRHMAAAMRNETCSGPLEYRIVRPDGDVRHVREQKEVTRDSSGRALRMIGTVMDITERRRAEESARQAREQLAHASRLRTIGEMASVLAHEINQPLAALSNFAQGCVQRLRAGRYKEADLLDAMEQITTQARRASEIISRVRRFARAQAPRHRAVDINDVVKEAVGLAEVEFRRDGPSTHLELAEDLPPVDADGIELQQVIVNLVHNGYEACGSTDRDDRTLIIRTSRGTRDRIEVAVRDFGSGLPDVSPDRVFEPFFTTKQDGMGMGLSISRSIIEAYGGQLVAIPNRDRGATFKFSLPAGGGLRDGQ